jgi:hypothetical protein
MMDEIVKARVENGVVVEAFLINDIPFPNDIYRAELADWITAPTEVGVGWLYNGEIFTPPME